MLNDGPPGVVVIGAAPHRNRGMWGGCIPQTCGRCSLGSGPLVSHPGTGFGVMQPFLHPPHTAASPPSGDVSQQHQSPRRVPSRKRPAECPAHGSGGSCTPRGGCTQHPQPSSLPMALPIPAPGPSWSRVINRGNNAVCREAKEHRFVAAGRRAGRA